MNNLKKLVNKTSYSEVVMMLLFPIINLIYYFPLSRLKGDTASMLLSALAPLNNIGYPYVDFWDIKPPGILIVFYSWARLFGQSLASFKLLHFFVNILLSVLIFYVYKKIINSKYVGGFFILTSFLLFSPVTQSLLLSSEMFGLLFSIIALYLLLVDFKYTFLSAFMFFLSSQMKEPFAIASLAVFSPVLIELVRKSFRNATRYFVMILLGFTTSLLFVLLYLKLTGSIYSYLEVLEVKQVYFSINKIYSSFFPVVNNSFEMLFQFSMLIKFLILGTLFFVVSKIYNSKIVFKKNVISNNIGTLISQNAVVIVLYIFGSVVGFSTGNNHNSHYSIQIIFPVILMCAIYFQVFINYLNLFKKGKRIEITFKKNIAYIITLLVLFPHRSYFDSYQKISLNRPVLEVDLSSIEKNITKVTDKNDCIMSVYGWGVSETYLNTKRRPCTRFFIPNILPLSRKGEYYEDIYSNLPAIVYYTDVMTDMNVNEFESTKFNWKQLLEKCYTKIDDIYVLDKSDCMQNN